MDADLRSSLPARRPRVLEELRRPIAGRRFRPGEIAITGEVLVLPATLVPSPPVAGPTAHRHHLP